jgi:hypothetical protein
VTAATPDGSGRLRVSDADRERAAELLNRAVAEGRLTLGEFEERMSTAVAARTRAELEALLRDLPEAARWLSPPPLPPPVRKESVHLRAGVGDVRRRGYWQVPPSIQVSGGMGDAILDFTEAEISSPVTTIDVSLGMGNLMLVVPPGVTVDADDVYTTIGDVKNRTDSRPGQRTHHIVVRGRLGMGDVKIMHPSVRRFGPWLIHRPFRITRRR